jgi:hypothetical protein
LPMPLRAPPEHISTQLAGMEESHRDDFDIVPHNLVVRCTRNDNGFDLPALLMFRNRSTKHIHIKPSEASFSIDGKVPVNSGTSGVSSPMKPEHTETLRFQPIRLYSENERHGVCRMIIHFGEDSKDMRCALSIEYLFTVRSYPKDKSTDAVVAEDLDVRARYYVRSGD